MNTKNRVLELLERQRGESISGEYIAGLLDISRNAVWKAITELRKDGYHILAVTHKGYCLSDENDIISMPGIKPFLSDSVQSYADSIHIYKSLESTSRTAKEMAIAGAAHGTVILADTQTAGRGRYLRSFFSPAGGLYMSMILRPEAVQIGNPASVTAFAAVSVCEAIEAVSGKAPQIKWVNDIFMEGKKVGGILTEAVTDFESGGLEWIVLGIGINVCVRPADFPVELQSTATSVYPDETVPGVRSRLAAEVINRILGCGALPAEAAIFTEYRKRLMTIGQKITVIQGQAAYQATAVDLDAAGHLIVKKENGEIMTVSSGEIRMPAEG